MSAQVDAFLEMWLYPYGTIGQIQVKENDPGNPYVDFTIATPMTVRDALSDLETQVNAWSSGNTFAFALTPSGGLSLTSDAASWQVDMSASMKDALGLTGSGFLDSELDDSDEVVSTVTPLAYAAPLGIGYRAPQSVERVDLREYNHGRTSAYHSRHGRTVEVTIHVEESDIDDIVSGPLGTHCKTRLFPTDSASVDAYTADALDGYLDVYPLEIVDVDRKRWGVAIITVTCLLEEAV